MRKTVRPVTHQAPAVPRHPLVRNFNYETVFGWVFPEAATMTRRCVIDTTWLEEFNGDITTLQWEIEKQAALVHRDNVKLSHEDVLRTYGRAGKCYESPVKGREKIDATHRNSRLSIASVGYKDVERSEECGCGVEYHESTVKCGEKSYSSDRNPRISVTSIAQKDGETSGEADRKLSCNDSGFGDSLCLDHELELEGSARGAEYSRDARPSLVSVTSIAETDLEESGKEVASRQLSCNEDSGYGDSLCPDMNASTREGEYTGETELPVLVSKLSASSVTAAKCDECNSMLSDVSRDSGVFTADDVHCRGTADKSLLQELDDAFTDQDVPIESCVNCNKSLPIMGIMQLNNVPGNSYPVWMSRFASGNVPSSSWGSWDWDRGEDLMSSSPQSISYKEHSERRLTEDDGRLVESLNAEEREEESRMRQIESVRSRTVSRKNSDVSALSKSLRRVNQRLDALHSDLSGLVSQARDCKHDLLSLEERTTKLLTSTVVTRRRFAQVKALQKLEERLQEEWWAAYDPDTIPLHENYIV